MKNKITSETKLEDFDDKMIFSIVDEDLDETTYLDFKTGLDSKIDEHKHNIRQCIASFANTSGGFIVFGLADKQTGKVGRDRIVGEEELGDPGKQITEKYLDNELFLPLASFEGPKKIEMDNDKTVYVIKVLSDEFKPYGVKIAKDRSLEFWYRGNGKKQPMDFYTLTLLMDTSKQRRFALRILQMELEEVVLISEGILANIERRAYYPPPYGNLLVDTTKNLYDLLKNDEKLSKKILQIRISLSRMDATISRYTDALIESTTIAKNSDSTEIADKLRVYIKIEVDNLRELSVNVLDELKSKFKTLK